MTKHRAIVLLIVLGIVLQNTCPFGLAEKTAAASPSVHHHCPLKLHNQKAADTGPATGTGDVQDVQKHFKPFTLMSFKIESVGRPDVLVERAQPALADRYEEAIVALPMKPPKSASSADC
jgi:hypothetical protein